MITYTLNALWANKVLMVGVIGWTIAQVLKCIIYACINKTFDLSRLFGDGGMPSAHSATVSSMAIMSGLIYGVNSFEFAIAAMFAIIVMHDAMGVRLETGKQAKIINELTTIIANIDGLANDYSEEKLKEFVGHTPLQVCAGATLGTMIAFAMHTIWF